MANYSYTYANSGDSSAGISFENLSDLIKYMEEVVAGTQGFGFIFQNDTMILKYKSNKDGIIWLPISTPLL
jgi:hypothetical protein